MPYSRKLHPDNSINGGLGEQMQIKALSEGDITVFEMLFRNHYQPLCNFLQDKKDAEEIVQSTSLIFRESAMSWVDAWESWIALPLDRLASP